MKKNTYKVLAAVLGFSLILGTAGAAAAAGASNDSKNENVAYEKTELETTNSDSVYVITDANGKNDKIILDDLTEVSPESTTPVSVNAKYYLDGKEMTPAEILGKTGHVVIRYNYVNNAKRNVAAGEKTVEMTVPYAVAVAAVLDGERFSNVTVNSGKVVDDGDRYAVIGIAFPGMKDNLGVSDEIIRIPEYTEIEADVKDFRLDIAYTLCSGAMFASTDMDMNDISTEISEKVTSLTTAVTQLVTGAGQLAEGSKTLYEGVAAYTGGAAQIAGGLNQIDANSAAIQNGAKAVFESLLASADSALKAAGVDTVSLTVENYDQVLTAIITKLSAGAGNAATDAAKAKLEGLLGQLRSYQAFYNGVLEYTNGVSQVTVGAAELNASSGALVEGAKKVSEGSQALYEGINQLNEEGIQKIVNILDGESLVRAKAMLELAKEENSTKNYIYKLESIR